MKINNAKLITICNIMENAYNRAKTTAEKWNISGVSERFYGARARYVAELNRLAKEKGESNENGEINVPTADLQELLKCESEVEPLTMDEIGILNLDIQSMIALRDYVADESK